MIISDLENEINPDNILKHSLRSENDQLYQPIRT